jgi:hypothetical protein
LFKTVIRLFWEFGDLARAIAGAQSGLRRPVIVEGIMLLHVLQQIGRTPDFHIFVEKEGHETSMKEDLEPYLNSYQPKSKADYVLRWSSADHDARVRRAHYEMRDGN